MQCLFKTSYCSYYTEKHTHTISFHVSIHTDTYTQTHTYTDTHAHTNTCTCAQTFLTVHCVIAIQSQNTNSMRYVNISNHHSSQWRIAVTRHHKDYICLHETDKQHSEQEPLWISTIKRSWGHQNVHHSDNSQCYPWASADKIKMEWVQGLAILKNTRNACSPLYSEGVK